MRPYLSPHHNPIRSVNRTDLFWVSILDLLTSVSDWLGGLFEWEAKFPKRTNEQVIYQPEKQQQRLRRRGPCHPYAMHGGRAPTYGSLNVIHKTHILLVLSLFIGSGLLSMMIAMVADERSHNVEGYRVYLCRFLGHFSYMCDAYSYG